MPELSWVSSSRVYLRGWYLIRMPGVGGAVYETVWYQDGIFYPSRAMAKRGDDNSACPVAAKTTWQAALIEAEGAPT